MANLGKNGGSGWGDMAYLGKNGGSGWGDMAKFGKNGGSGWGDMANLGLLALFERELCMGCAWGRPSHVMHR